MPLRNYISPFDVISNADNLTKYYISKGIYKHGGSIQKFDLTSLDLQLDPAIRNDQPGLFWRCGLFIEFGNGL